MSLVKTIDLGELTKTMNLSVTSINGISNLYELSGNNTTSRTQTYEINGNEINDIIKSNTDHIVLKFNVYPHSLDSTDETASCVVDNDTVFYIENQSAFQTYEINYVLKSSILDDLINSTNKILIHFKLESKTSSVLGNGDSLYFDRYIDVYAIYKPEFSSITGSNREVDSGLLLDTSFDASSQTIANANACEIKGSLGSSSVGVSSGSVTFNLKDKLLHNKPVSLFFNSNIKDFDSDENDTLRIKVSNGPKITLTESDISMLQTEFIVTNENHEEPTWYANYVKEGSNGSTSLTNSSTGFQYNSDTNGPYFLVNSSSVNVTLQNYPNQSYLLNMDTSSGAVLCYEIWCYYSGDDGTISNKGWLMGVETSYGPYIVLTDSRIGGIGTTPGDERTNNDTYTSLTNPGYITDNANKGQLLHIVGYWEQDTNSNHERGVYINGTHYPQETTTESGQSNKPGFDSILSGQYFQVGGRGSSDHSALGVRIYSFRIWHGDIRSKVSTLYEAGPHASVINNYKDILELNSSNNDELKTVFYSQIEDYDSSYNFDIKFSLTGTIKSEDFVYFENMFTYIPEAINFFDASGINPSGSITLEPDLLINSNEYVGSIELFNSLPLPDNYILCDGREITKSDNGGNYYAPLIDFLNGNTTDNSCCLPNFHEKHPLGVDSGISNYNSSTSNHIGNNQLAINYFPSHNHSANASSATTNAYNIEVNKTGRGGINILPTNDRLNVVIKDGSAEGSNIPLDANFHSHTHNIDFNNMITDTAINTQVNYTRTDTINANTEKTISNTLEGAGEINTNNYPLQLKSYKLYFGIRFK